MDSFVLCGNLRDRSIHFLSPRVFSLEKNNMHWCPFKVVHLKRPQNWWNSAPKWLSFCDFALLANCWDNFSVYFLLTIFFLNYYHEFFCVPNFCITFNHFGCAAFIYANLFIRQHFYFVSSDRHQFLQKFTYKLIN